MTQSPPPKATKRLQTFQKKTGPFFRWVIIKWSRLKWHYIEPPVPPPPIA